MKFEYTDAPVDPTTGARALTPASASALLNKIIVLFDLDSTLLDNRARNAQITLEFGAQNNISALRKARPEHWQDWSARNAMSAIGLSSQEIDDLFESYTAYWDARFFTSHYCQYDTAVAGAEQFVTLLLQAGGIVRYLTGRHEAMRPGTLKSLETLGFPCPNVSSDVDLIMKAERSIDDDDYKQKALAQFDTQSAVLAAFDNEPKHINTYRATFPNATCIHLDTDHSMRPIRLLGGIVSIVDFKHQ